MYKKLEINNFQGKKIKMVSHVRLIKKAFQKETRNANKMQMTHWKAKCRLDIDQQKENTT